MAFPYINYPQNYFPASYQPMPYPQQTYQQQPQSGIIWISSANEVDAYPVAPNSAVALWHKSEPVVYIKQADATGKPAVHPYKLTDLAAPVPAEENDAAKLSAQIKAMQEALEALTRDVKTLIKEDAQ